MKICCNKLQFVHAEDTVRDFYCQSSCNAHQVFSSVGASAPPKCVPNPSPKSGLQVELNETVGVRASGHRQCCILAARRRNATGSTPRHCRHWIERCLDAGAAGCSGCMHGRSLHHQSAPRECLIRRKLLRRNYKRLTPARHATRQAGEL